MFGLYKLWSDKVKKITKKVDRQSLKGIRVDNNRGIWITRIELDAPRCQTFLCKEYFIV